MQDITAIREVENEVMESGPRDQSKHGLGKIRESSSTSTTHNSHLSSSRKSPDPIETPWYGLDPHTCDVSNLTVENSSCASPSLQRLTSSSLEPDGHQPFSSLSLRERKSHMLRQQQPVEMAPTNSNLNMMMRRKKNQMKTTYVNMRHFRLLKRC